MAEIQYVAQGAQRRFLTYVAIVCDVPHIQKVLPQFVIANERTIPAPLLGHLRSRSPSNVHLLRERTAWVTTAIMCMIARAVSAALTPFRAGYPPIFSVDACKAHLAPAVFTACAAAKLWPLLVPARMTWLLQPLDTHVLSLFKAALQQAFQAARIRAADGRVDLSDLLTSVYAATQLVLKHNTHTQGCNLDGSVPKASTHT